MISLSLTTVKETFLKRTKIITALRRYMDSHSFIEVETPMMQSIPGGATAKPFLTHHNALDMDLYLRIAPELYLKRLLVGGFERVYEVNRNFRNEGISTRHNPEFTMMEFYMAYADYTDLMAFTEDMISTVAKEVLGTTIVPYQGATIDLTPPWKRYTLKEAAYEVGGVEAGVMEDLDKARAFCKNAGMELAGNESLGDLQLIIFETTAEEKLMEPDLYHLLPHGGLSAFQEKQRRPKHRRPLRALYHRPRDRQRLFRAE